MAKNRKTALTIIHISFFLGLLIDSGYCQFPPDYYSYDYDCTNFRCLETYKSELITSGSPYIRVIDIGQSSAPNPKTIYAFEISDFSIPESQKRRVFIIGRLHGNEYTQNYVFEGLINYLLYSSDSIVTKMLSSVHLIIIPISNPYGANNLKITNINGKDLQTDWHASWSYATEQSETAAVHSYLDQWVHDFGLDLILNIHDPYRAPVGPATPTPLATPIDGDYGWRGPYYHPAPFYRPDQFNRITTFAKALNSYDPFHETQEWDKRIFSIDMLDATSLAGGCDRNLYSQHKVEICSLVSCQACNVV